MSRVLSGVMQVTRDSVTRVVSQVTRDVPVVMITRSGTWYHLQMSSLSHCGHIQVVFCKIIF